MHKYRGQIFNKNKKAFTIVELLVVIVVIGILAAITIVSYSGVANKATAASIQSDLSSNAKILKMYYVDNGYYPSAVDSETGCPTPADTKYCLRASNDAILAYSGGGQTFTLSETKNGITYEITENLSPYYAVKTPLTAISAVTGSPMISQTLTAGSLTPSSATVSYQWQKSATVNGVYSDISGATNNTYTLLSGDLLNHIRVVVTGTGDYVGTQTSSAVTAIDPNWITIGSQTWAKADMNVGAMVTGVTTQTNNSILEKYCYSDLESNCTTYGGLYQWDEAMQYDTVESAQGICPIDSHIPSDGEWKTLELYLGMSQSLVDTLGLRSGSLGTILKTGGSSGLEVDLSGYRYNTGEFFSMSASGYLWTSTKATTNVNDALIRQFGTTGSTFRIYQKRVYGYTVRCVGN